jgi:hypothetical protein
MKIGRTTTVGILLLIALFTPIIYAKYASVNAIILMLRGNLESGPPFVNVKLLHIIFGFDCVNLSSGKEVPTAIVMKQFNNNNAKKIIPFISELNIADNAKKLIKMNGANLNPIYIIDCTFNTFIIFGYETFIQIHYIIVYCEV